MLRPTDRDWNSTLVESFLEYFGARGHERMPWGSAIPENDPTTLFTSGGIQPWRDWVLANESASHVGRASAQWCVRMTRFNEVGAGPFLTSFIMLTAVSRLRLSRELAIERLLAFLAEIGLDPGRVGFVIGDEQAGRPPDSATAEALGTLGIGGERVALRRHNWAAPFDEAGPTGPQVFVYFDRTHVACGATCGPLCTCGRYFHFWSLEFLENTISSTGTIRPLETPFLDCAGSLEWLLCVLLGARSPFDAPPLRSITELLASSLEAAGVDSSSASRCARTLADHCRTTALLLSYGVEPGPKKRGHVLRRIVRRSLGLLSSRGLEGRIFASAVEHARALCSTQSSALPAWRDEFSHRLAAEITSFESELQGHRARYERLLESRHPTAADLASEIFDLWSTRGAPLEILRNWLHADGIDLDEECLARLLDQHRRSSRQGPGSLK